MEMLRTTAISKTSIKAQTLATMLAVIAAVALPQLFHQLGAVSGLGTSLGSTVLPMHLPILLVGLVAGPVAGSISGLLAPILSFAMSGMPTSVMLLFMVIELAVYGLMSGLLRDVKLPTIGKIVVAQVAGRVVRAGAILLSVYAFGNQTMQVSTIWASILPGIPGLILQWSILPLVIFWINNRQRHEQ